MCGISEAVGCDLLTPAPVVIQIDKISGQFGIEEYNAMPIFV
jgi:hypothetical protein